MQNDDDNMTLYSDTTRHENLVSYSVMCYDIHGIKIFYKTFKL